MRLCILKEIKCTCCCLNIHWYGQNIKLMHLRLIFIFQAYTIQLYINEMIKNISKIPEHIPWFWNNQSNIFTPSYKSVIYEVLTCDILTRLRLRIACSDFSEFMVTYHMTIFGKLLILSKLLKLRFYNG